MRFGLYVHIPYCQAKCPYCDFNSYAAARWPERRYVDALCAELRHYAALSPWRGGEIQTIFFGGGTPSLFAAESIGQVLDEASRLWPVAPDVETTLEANPGTISLDKLSGFCAAGINRMSFGVQSFAPHHLRTLGRIHGPDEAAAAVRLARQAGLTNVSIDLIYALPQQTLEEWESDLTRACALQPDHLSAYNLTYEEGTPFHQWRTKGKLRSLPEEIEVAMFTGTQDILTTAGYAQYEISNYARPGQACRHNVSYWCGGAYLGVGAGAHSYSGVTDGSTDWGCRWSDEKNPNTYIRDVVQQGHACRFSETLDARQARGEFVFLGLRCCDGFAATAFRERFGAELPALFSHVDDLRDGGLLECSAGRWRLTPRGLLLADSVFATFL
ncbi:MAG TPA: radical SAM family heme chaperone HemW [Candidatus Acidoferrales bacterium]|nr:radical SAM family heme chaperone HemW [Candidatus Acidoferrales bacterium]